MDEDTSPQEAALFLEFGITENSEPPIKEYMKYYNEPEALTPHEKQIVEKFSIGITILEDYKISHNIPARYVAKFLDAFCIGEDNFYSLNKQGQDAIKSTFRSKSALFNKAMKYSNCLKK